MFKAASGGAPPLARTLRSWRTLHARRQNPTRTEPFARRPLRRDQKCRAQIPFGPRIDTLACFDGEAGTQDAAAPAAPTSSPARA